MLRAPTDAVLKTWRLRVLASCLRSRVPPMISCQPGMAAAKTAALDADRDREPLGGLFHLQDVSVG